MSTRSTPVTYDYFRQRVRRFHRSDLVVALAREAVALHRHEFGDGPDPRLHEATAHFSLAGVAIAALRYGNDHRKPGATWNDIAELCALYVNVYEPALDQSPIDLRGLLHRMAYEQFPYQISLMEQLGRTTALFLGQRATCDAAPTHADWARVLGVGLSDFTAIGFALHVAALRGDGILSRRELASPNWAPVWSQLDTVGSFSEVAAVIDRFFCQTVDDIRDQQLGVTDEYAKWAFNPLVAKPLVELDSDRLVAPEPRLLLHRIAPTGLYFIGLDAFGAAFPDSLGCLFEAYVGAQLRSLGRGSVSPEIVFGKPEQKTVDWFLVLDELVVLVEAKAYRPIEATRLGVGEGDDDLLSKLGKGVDQLQRTYQLLLDGRPELSHIPTDRPIVGLVVTLEPFHLANTLIWDQALPASDIPSAIVPIHEFEGVIGAAKDALDIEQRIQRALTPTPPSPPSLRVAVDDLEPMPNPILDAAWARFPWMPGDE